MHRALQAGRAAIEGGERDRMAVRSTMLAVLDEVTRSGIDCDVDYLDAVEAGTLAPVDPLQGEIRLLAAARFGRARLIDNEGVTVPAPTDGR